MSILFLISLFVDPDDTKTVLYKIAHALFLISDALWFAVISKVLEWW